MKNFATSAGSIWRFFGVSEKCLVCPNGARFRPWASGCFVVVLIAVVWAAPAGAQEPAGQISGAVLAAESPLMKFSRAFSRPDPDVGEMGLLMEEWAGADLAGALQWTATVPPGTMRDVAMAAIVSVWSRRDPVAAADFLRFQIADASVLHEAIQKLAVQWGASDLKAVRDWGETLEGSQALSALLGGTQAASSSKYRGGRKP